VISCSESIKQLWDYLEGEVSGPERTALEEHLKACRTCCGDLEFAGELDSFLASHAEVDLPADVHNRLVSFLSDL
jgi:anti-sigma factor (TIGR02949 family)